eukprot:RCo037039
MACAVSFLQCPPSLVSIQARAVFCAVPRRWVLSLSNGRSVTPAPSLVLALRMLSQNPELGVRIGAGGGISLSNDILCVDGDTPACEGGFDNPDLPECLPALWQLCFSSPDYDPCATEPPYLDLLSTVEMARVHRLGAARHPGAVKAWLRHTHRSHYSLQGELLSAYHALPPDRQFLYSLWDAWRFPGAPHSAGHGVGRPPDVVRGVLEKSAPWMAQCVRCEDTRECDLL